MNKWQKEVLGNRIASEETLLKEVKDSYKQALKDIDNKIAQLMAREDKENLQTIIYQVDYQKSLKTQINAILNDLNTKQFDSISQYLTESYEDGFIGTMYDLQKQGIPLITPIDEKSVVRAIKTNTKLSKGLWGDLADYNSDLQNQIRAEVSRGISQGFSYSQIAKNLAERMNIGYNNAARIARTESHRISQEATLDAQYKAKEAGADVVKQWDAALDKRTRSQHAQLDGQIREIDEPFEINGHKAMYPGGFDNAGLDINCRCVILQQAKWALDEEELKTLKERAEYFGLDKTKDFEEYKKKYIESVEKIKKSEHTRDVKVASAKEINELKKEFDRTKTPNFNEMRRYGNADARLLTNTEINGIKGYSGADYTNINQILRGQTQEIKPALTKKINAIKTALNKTITKEDIKVMRGTGIAEIEGLTGLKLKGLNSKEISKLLVGKTYTNSAFTLTTISNRVADAFSMYTKNVRLEIILPKGSKAMYIESLSSNMVEQEVLIQSGAKLEFFDVYREENRFIFKCKVVGYE